MSTSKKNYKLTDVNIMTFMSHMHDKICVKKIN